MVLEKIRNDCLIVRILQRPEILSELTIKEWDLLLRQARRGDLLGKLALLLEQQQDIVSGLTAGIKDTLYSAIQTATKHRQTINWEIACIKKSLQDLPGPVIFLKGAAYIMLDLPVANGRLFSDVDIMVKKDLISKAENLLIISGWAAIKQSDYDQKYYRKWMHEIPPLRHRRRRTVIDVHHHILPDTARFKPDIHKLIETSVQTDSRQDMRVLSPVDMILHSMTHLFCEGEFNHGLRDLVDIDGLLRYHSDQSGFWDKLPARADELQLGIPLFYGLRYAKSFLSTPIPDTIWLSPVIWKPGRLRLYIMDALFKRALVPEHASCELYFTAIARFMLYIRGHYLRMPFHLLIPHLLIKLIMGWKDQEKQ